MKKTSILIFILLSSVGISTAQIPTEAFELTNSLSDLWTRGKTDEAVQRSLRLYELYPRLLFDRFNTTLSQCLKYSSSYKNASLFIEQLYQRNNLELNKAIKPIYLWSKAMRTNDADSLKELIRALSNTLNDSMTYWSKAETYCLVTLNSIGDKNLVATKTKTELVYKIIRRLESNPYLKKEVTQDWTGEQKAWRRFLLAYSYYYLYTKVENKEEFLKKASDYSPDSNDRLYKQGYFYDEALLIGEHDNNYKSVYQNYLLAHNRNSESLSLLSQITFENPCDSNIHVLSNHYSSLNSNGSFTKYWEDYVDKKGKPLPPLTVRFKDDTLDFSKKPGKWIFIDVWGTWYGPCVEELPTLQAFFATNKDNDNLKVYTFSYQSNSLKAFMDKNNYSFPVSEIDKVVKERLHISSFPTKILISPNGNYFEIPFGEDWTMYVKNYTRSSI